MYLADCVVHLKYNSDQANPTRLLNIVKCRNSRHSPTSHPFQILRGLGIVIDGVDSRRPTTAKAPSQLRQLLLTRSIPKNVRDALEKSLDGLTDEDFRTLKPEQVLELILQQYQGAWHGPRHRARPPTGGGARRLRCRFGSRGSDPRERAPPSSVPIPLPPALRPDRGHGAPTPHVAGDGAVACLESLGAPVRRCRPDAHVPGRSHRPGGRRALRHPRGPGTRRRSRGHVRGPGNLASGSCGSSRADTAVD